MCYITKTITLVAQSFLCLSWMEWRLDVPDSQPPVSHGGMGGFMKFFGYPIAFCQSPTPW